MFSKPSFRITIVVLVLGAAFVTLAFLNRESGKRSASAPAAAVSSGLTFHGRGGGGAVSRAAVTDPAVLRGAGTGTAGNRQVSGCERCAGRWVHRHAQLCFRSKVGRDGHSLH